MLQIPSNFLRIRIQLRILLRIRMQNQIHALTELQQPKFKQNLLNLFVILQSDHKIFYWLFLLPNFEGKIINYA